MKVCDRHPRTECKETISLESTDEVFDLCDDCMLQIREFLNRSEVKDLAPKKGRKN